MKQKPLRSKDYTAPVPPCARCELEREPEAIVQRIIADLRSRRGLRQEWEGIDTMTRVEIRQTWTSFVRGGE